MRAIILMFDSLNRHLLPPYGQTFVKSPNFERLAACAQTFDNFYAGSMPCIPARREMHTGRYNFLHRSWGPLEPFDDSIFQMLSDAGIHTHLVSDHPHYWEDGGATYHTRYTTWDAIRGQEGDRWKGNVAAAVFEGEWPECGHRQHQVNTAFVHGEADHSQTRTVDGGLEFLETNRAQDNWLLQIECFDPHEPFFTLESYLGMYGCEPDEPQWPRYQRVGPDEDVDQMRRHYAALLSQCDHSLGRVLDAMDQYRMWDDTLLLVNTDHGYLLGEHGWWAKNRMPWFNELVHIPAFLWDPRVGNAGGRRADLAQTIDIAPTLLRYFGLTPTEDMMGRDLADSSAAHRAVLFGTHGEYVNITDGRYVYMRGAATPGNSPRKEYTLMPTGLGGRCTPDELRHWRPAQPFSFTKGVPVMEFDGRAGSIDSWASGTLLYDCESDPGQHRPIVDDQIELRMLRGLVELMQASDAPAGEFERLGLPQDNPGPQHLRARLDRARVAGSQADYADDDRARPDQAHPDQA